MKRVLVIAVAVEVLLSGSVFASGAAASQKEAKALVEKAVAFAKANGQGRSTQGDQRGQGPIRQGRAGRVRLMT